MRSVTALDKKKILVREYNFECSNISSSGDFNRLAILVGNNSKIFIN